LQSGERSTPGQLKWVFRCCRYSTCRFFNQAGLVWADDDKLMENIACCFLRSSCPGIK